MNKRLLILGALVTTIVASPGVFTAVDAAAVAAQGSTVTQGQAMTSKLDTILATGVLRVGVTGDYKPMAYFNGTTQQYEGIEIDLANSLAKSLGVKVEFVKTSWPTLLQDTLDDKFDVAMSGITRTYAREQKAFMSDGYITFGKTVLMRDKDKKKYTSIEAMNQSSVRVGVNPGGTNEKFVRTNLPNATIIVHDKNAEIPGLVANGTYDIMVTENLEAVRYEKEFLNLTHLPKLLTKNQFGVLMQRDQVLLNYVNMWLAQQELEHNIEAIVEAHE